MAEHRKEIYFDSSRIIQRLFTAIEAAQKSIYFEYYIFELDSAGEQILEALCEAGRRGVHVRILVDGIGSLDSIDKIRDRISGKNVELRIYNPIPWPLSSKSLESNWIHVLRLWGRINRRNHKKLAVFDGSFALVGSQNIHAPEPPWRETAIWIGHPEVRVLEKSFLASWFRSFIFRKESSFHLREFKYERKRHDIILFNDNWFNHRRNWKRLLKKLDEAQARVWIITPYFVPVYQLSRKLIRAQQRGVDVRVLLPGPTDVQIVKWVSQIYMASLLRHGVRIYEYQKRILHAKQMLIDAELQVGSSNLNRRSFYHDLELDIVVSDSEIVKATERQFLADLEVSDLLRFEDWRLRRLLNKILGVLVSVFRNWL